MIDDGANVKAWDPVGIDNFKKSYPHGITYCYSIEETIKDADICFIFTEWDEVKNFDLYNYSKLMNNPIVIDGRNCYDLVSVKNAKVVYDSIGRETINSLEMSLL